MTLAACHPAYHSRSTFSEETLRRSGTSLPPASKSLSRCPQHPAASASYPTAAPTSSIFPWAGVTALSIMSSSQGTPNSSPTYIYCVLCPTNQLTTLILHMACVSCTNKSTATAQSACLGSQCICLVDSTCLLWPHMHME